MQAEKEQLQPRKNPLIWVTLIVIGLILYIFFGADRGGVSREPISLKPAQQVETIPEESLQTEALIPPGARAREMIQQVRAQGEPYDFEQLMASASKFASEGSLADAHLMFFFAAREGHVEAMMMMAEMSDPTLFRAENNLLDKADAIQAYKWYRLALDKGFEPARSRLENLHQWARAESDYGNTDAQQLLLNYN